jgi:hypothetical protein
MPEQITVKNALIRASQANVTRLRDGRYHIGVSKHFIVEEKLQKASIAFTKDNLPNSSTVAIIVDPAQPEFIDRLAEAYDKALGTRDSGWFDLDAIKAALKADFAGKAVGQTR